jgi:hypothetical protein
MTTIRKYVDPVQAGLIQSMLRSHNITAVLLDEGASAWTAGRVMIPIRLAVPDNQVSEAKQILLDMAAPVNGDADSDSPDN